MIQLNVSISNPEVLRAIKGNTDFQNVEMFPVKSNGHKFEVGEMRTLTGLENFPEYNGQQVKITNIRKDGTHGKAYYIEGAINEVLNWTYEYRLK